MANTNPIQVDTPAVETEFILPKKYAGTMIYLSLKVDIKEDKWLYAAAHSIFLSGKNIFPQLNPEPEDLKLKYATMLNNKRLVVYSHISCINNDDAEGEVANPTVSYTMILEGGSELIQEFKVETKENNPSNFRSIILFKLES